MEDPKRIADIDSHMAVATLEGVPVVFHDVRKAPLDIYGLLWDENGYFTRIPQAIADATNDGVKWLNRHTAGGRVRFIAETPYVAIRVKMPQEGRMPIMTPLCSSGFDLYFREGDEPFTFMNGFMPPIVANGGYESLLYLPGGNRRREFLIHFPLYDAVDSLEIGVAPDVKIEGGQKYRNDKPWLFYGSSITQGGCASRGGTCYNALLSRRFNCDFRNLGWSGSGRGEQVMADYIAAQPMSLFFMDYDHNAPDAAHLAATHEKFFLTVREKNPDLPIIIASRTDPMRTADDAADNDARFREVCKTYENALRRGDKLVRLIDGRQIFAPVGQNGLAMGDATVDGCHPTDLGFLLMAETFAKPIQELLNL
ncbi:MAG: SGNH/GDSL hydrolase family protein [Clostridia bacterium]|nr:SGNH/GDSL hydrolase family protein [Clostridia bacterium]